MMEDTLKEILQELREIKSLLAARDAERGNTVNYASDAVVGSPVSVEIKEEEAEDSEVEDEGCAAVGAIERGALRDAASMMRVFTLNDKFRFRRELFGGSDAAMTEAIEALAGCGSMDEAAAYMHDTLGWNSDTVEVSDFVSVIEPFYR